MKLPDGRHVDIDLRRSARARRLTLRVSARDGRVSMTVPPRVSAADAMAFAQSREGWLVQQLAAIPPAAPLAIGASVPVDGVDRRLEVGEGRAVVLCEHALSIPARRAKAPAASVAAFLKLHARDRLTAASDHYAALVGRRFTRLTLRDTRSRWGSCSSAGALMYSWRLAMAPPAVRDYVAAHEVAHLVEMNHSAAFWSVVAGLMPDYETHRQWLRDHGAALQRIRLD